MPVLKVFGTIMLDRKRWRCVVECEVLEERIFATSHAVTDLGAAWASSTSMAQSCDKADLFGYWNVLAGSNRCGKKIPRRDLTRHRKGVITPLTLESIVAKKFCLTPATYHNFECRRVG